jgi:hypothetical protein
MQYFMRSGACRCQSSKAEASAQRALTGLLPDLERAILEDCALSVKDNLFQTGLAAVSRSNEAGGALSKATTTLEVARQALVGTGIYSRRIEGCGIFQGHSA